MNSIDAPQVDSIFQTYDRSFYKRGYDDPLQDQLAQMSSDNGANNSIMVNVPSDLIGSGQGTGMSQVSSGGMMSGKETFGDNTAGFFLGIDTDGIAKWNFGNSTNFITWNGSTLTVTGSVNVGSLNIPDMTTANSFHVATNGNTWWGANVATGYTGANAYVLANGSSVFKDIQMGGTTIQYTITNSGIFSFGDGSDGDATISINTTLTSDKYYSNLTINDGVTLIPGSYRIFVKNILTLGAGSSGKIALNGAVGGKGQPGGTGGSHGGGGTGGSLANGYLNGSVGGDGGAGHSGNGDGLAGNISPSATNCLNTGAAGTGGNGGSEAPASGGPGAAAGTSTASNVKLIANWHLATLLDIIKTDATPTGYKRGQTIPFSGSSAGGGGGGGANNQGTGIGCGGGGGGSNGGIVAIYARIIVMNSGSSITANGGNGGDGGDSDNLGNAWGGGGGGGGGSGGIIVLVYNSLTNNGSITVTAGSGGSPGIGSANGTSGTVGSAGTIYQFQLSL